MPVSPGVLVKCGRCAFPIWPTADWRAWEIAAERHLREIPWDCYEIRECKKHGRVMHSVRWRYREDKEKFKRRVICVECARYHGGKKRLGVDIRNAAG